MLPTMPLRVVLADDAYLAREAVAHVLATADDVEVVAVCADRDSLLAAIAAERPDVVVTDIRMPPDEDAEGIRVAQGLRRSHPEIGVVVLSQYAEPRYALDLLAGGSRGRAYLLKERVHNRAELTEAIHAVASDGSVIDPKVVDVLVAAELRDAVSPVTGLSDRERDVLAQVAQGKSNPAIAAALDLTSRAVEKHVNAIFTKLELRGPEDISRRVTAALMFLADEAADPATAGLDR
jgi:DNA-binding NarL/FixJ family response regulator